MAALTAQEQQELAYEDNTPTPTGWRRKLIPHIGKGLVPARTDVVFVSPSGEEFKSKAQLQRYLKVNKGSPLISDFIWSTDETPRRSSRSASKRSKSPPKTTNKKKHAAEIPLEEAKAIKRSHPEKESVREETSSENKERPNKKARKVIPSECKEDINGKASPIECNKDINGDLTSVVPSRKAKGEKKKPMKDMKKKKRAKAEAKTNKASINMNESSPIAQKSEEQHENGKEEKVEMNGKEETMVENEKEEEPNSLEEKGVIETQKMQTEVQEDNEAKDLNDDMENEGVENDDGNTTSMLGSDLSAEGMEANSDVFESKEGRATHEHEEETNTAPQGQDSCASEGS